VVLVVIIVFAIFASYSLYDKSFPVRSSPSQLFDLRIIQIDDFGSFWDSREAANVLAEVEAQSLLPSSSTFVVVFVHGWHHNAKSTDRNMQEFGNWLSRLSGQLSRPNRRAARQELTGSPEFRLIGIYVGWRGRSLPGRLDYFTMWWRKAAAERVGDGDLSEFLERLQRIYLRANAYSRYLQNPGRTPVMGLITVGHSFGGAAVLKAVARPLEEQLVMRAPQLADTASLPRKSERPAPEQVVIDAFGDINVLLNPAIEAYQYSRIDSLYRQLEYPPQQAPQLLVFSAENDVPRKFYFPIARALTRPFRPAFRNDQGALWGTALGELSAQRTHELRLAGAGKESLSDEDFVPADRQKIASFDFTSETAFSAVRLSRLPNAPVIANSPTAVIYTHDGIIEGHTGIFKPIFIDFLAEYAAFIQAKRALLRVQRYETQLASDTRS
jgi:hypothetical protein